MIGNARRSLVAALLAGAILLGCSTGSATPSPVSPEEHKELGMKALSAGRYRESIRHLMLAATGGIETIELRYWLGKAHWSRLQGPEAIRAYVRAVALDPEGASPWSLYALENLAEVSTRTDRLFESEAAYREALGRETRPEWIEKIENQLAELALTVGKYEPDERTVVNAGGEIVGGVGPGGMRTNRNFEIARHTSDPEKEAKYYRLAIDTDPTMYQSHFNLGLALTRLGRYEEAVPWLLKSDEVWKADRDYNPDRIDKADAHAFLALCFLELGDLDKAEEHSRIALAADGSYFWAILHSLRVLTARGRAEGALPRLMSLAASDPEHPETLFALSRAHAALGHREAAAKALGEAVASIPDGHPWLSRKKVEWRRLLE